MEVLASADICSHRFASLEIHVIQLKAIHKEISVNYDYTFQLPLLGKDGRDRNKGMERKEKFFVGGCQNSECESRDACVMFVSCKTYCKSQCLSAWCH